MEVERGRSIREEVSFLRAAQSLEGKGKGQETHKDFYWQEMPHLPLGMIYRDNRGTKRRCSPRHSATKRMWIGDDGEPNSIIWFLTWDDEPSIAKERDHSCNFVGKVLHAQTSNLQPSLSQMSTVPGTKSFSTSKILIFLWQSYFFLLPHVGVLFKVV